MGHIEEACAYTKTHLIFLQEGNSRHSLSKSQISMSSLWVSPTPRRSSCSHHFPESHHPSRRGSLRKPKFASQRDSWRPLRGPLREVLRGSVGSAGVPRDFPSSGSVLVTLGTSWIFKILRMEVLLFARQSLADLLLVSKSGPNKSP